MKKVIIGAIIATTLLNSSIAYANTNKEVLYKNITSLEGQICIPNFYKQMVFGYDEVTLKYEQLKELRDEFQDNSTKKDCHIKIVKAILSPNENKDSYSTKVLQKAIKPKVDEFVAKVEEKVSKEGENASFTVKLHYNAIIIYSEYDVYDNKIESFWFSNIIW